MITRYVLAAGLCTCMMACLGCSSHTASEPVTTRADPYERLEIEGCANVIRLTPGLISGSQPGNEAAFRALSGLGVKTLISVDGAKPDVETARRYGLRYVHLPFGYDSLPRSRGLEIARAVRDLPGPVYIHCHHGKHRGPTAAAVAAIVVEGWPEGKALQFMGSAGTSGWYTGLYASIGAFKEPSAAELDSADDSFPAVAELPDFVDAMATIDRRWDHLALVRDAGWATPTGHPDIDPPHEALQLHELFVELNRTEEVRCRSEDFRMSMRDIETATGRLHTALLDRDPAGAETAYQMIGESCRNCHNVYRDFSR